MSGSTAIETISYVEGLLNDLPGWETEARRELRTLLVNHDGKPSPARAREGQIGLLVEILLEEEEKWVTPTEYDLCACAKGNERWPKSRDLERAFGGRWSRALKAAQLVASGERRGVSNNAEHWKLAESSYTRNDFTSAIMRCRDALGFWPTYSKFDEWARFTRAGERRSKKRDKYLTPRVRAVVTHFGEWSLALEAAQRAFERREAKRDDVEAAKSRGARKKSIVIY